MSELQHYYDNVACVSSTWADPEDAQCGCGGRGWFLSEVDTWHKCPYHGAGVPHPEDRDECDQTHMPDEEGEPSHTVRAPVEPPVWDESAFDDIPF